MKTIDSHLHFWNLSNNINSWVFTTNDPLLKKNYMPKELLHKFAGTLHGFIHVEAHDSAIPTTKEVKWLNNVMEDITKIQYKHIAYADITLPNDEFIVNINELLQYTNVAGIRHILSYNPKFAYSPCNSDLSTNANIHKNLTYLAKNRLIFNCQMYPYQLNNILHAITDSDVTCVIDHLALPAWNNEDDNDHKLWKEMIIKLAKPSNIFLKVSGIDMFRKEPEFKSVIDFCFNNFPVSRLMYGSNYPVSFTNDYNYWYNYLNSLDLTHTTKEQLFFKNAMKVFFRIM